MRLTNCLQSGKKMVSVQQAREKMEKIQLVFIPAPAVGHIISTMEIVNMLINRDEHIYISVLIMKLPNDLTGVETYTNSLSEHASPRVRFVDLPPISDSVFEEVMSRPTNIILPAFVDAQKDNVRDAALEVACGTHSTRLTGFVVDMFCINMVDVANDLGVPTYAFFTSSAGFLGLMFRVQSLSDDDNLDIVAEFKNTENEFVVPSFVNPVRAKVLPLPLLDKEGGGTDMILSTSRRFLETKGILVNTFLELESHAIMSHTNNPRTPPVYPVGPLLNLKGGGSATTDDITRWLDDQPPLSVVFLCFGSMGRFSEDQVKEIAWALERVGHRFLWSLRRPPPKGKVDVPREYSSPEEVLTTGFLERTMGIGKVIGWAPQVTVLSHPSIGGFVSHCGWNSTLESLWFGVPMAAWPMYAEQNINAFQLVTDLGLAVDTKMDYKSDFSTNSENIVTAEEIESGIRQLMILEESKNKMRGKVTEIKERSRMAMLEDGSSYNSLGHFIDNIRDNIPKL